MLFNMDPGDKFCIRIWTAADDPRGGSFQIGNFNIIMLLDKPSVELPGRQELHQVGISPRHMVKTGPLMNMGLEELLVDTAAEKRQYRDVKP